MNRARERKLRVRMLNKRLLLIIPILLSISIVYASVFVYYPMSINTQFVDPTLLYDNPEYTYTCVALIRTARGAITYTDFETYPVSGWASRGGTNFQLVTGHKGYALQYSDNNLGIGSASQYYYNSRLDSYSSLWVTLKVYGSPTDSYKGISLINTGLNRLYEISIYSSSVYVWSFNVEAANGWYMFGSSSITGFNNAYWYTVVLNYAVVANAVTFQVWVYNPAGTQVAYLTASSTSARRFTPAYIGLEVDGTQAMFDDLEISRLDLRNVLFQNLVNGIQVRVYDNLGSLVYQFTATASTYTLSVVRDVVLGTGVNGRIEISYPDGTICLNRIIASTDAFLGGDTYSLATQSFIVSIDESKTEASVSAVISSSANHLTSFKAVKLTSTQDYYVMLELDTATSTIHPSLNVEISHGGTQTILISGGSVIQSSTDWVSLPSGSSLSITVRNAYMAGSASSILMLNVVGCVGGPDYVGACVIYPLSITLTGWTGSYIEALPLLSLPAGTPSEEPQVTPFTLLNPDFNDYSNPPNSLLNYWSLHDGAYLKWVGLSSDTGASSGVAMLSGSLKPEATDHASISQRVTIPFRMITRALLRIKHKFSASPAGQLGSQTISVGIFNADTGKVLWSGSITPSEASYSETVLQVPAEIFNSGGNYELVLSVSVISKGECDFSFYLDAILLELNG